MGTYESQAENLVLDSLGLAIADTYLVPQAIPAPRAQESVLQVVLLSSDPMKRVPRCVSNGAGQITLQQLASPMPFYSFQFPFLFVIHEGGASRSVEYSVFQHQYLCIPPVKILQLLSISNLTLLAAAAIKHAIHTLSD